MPPEATSAGGPPPVAGSGASTLPALVEERARTAPDAPFVTFDDLKGGRVHADVRRVRGRRQPDRPSCSGTSASGAATG